MVEVSVANSHNCLLQPPHIGPSLYEDRSPRVPDLGLESVTPNKLFVKAVQLCIEQHDIWRIDRACKYHVLVQIPYKDE